MTYLPNKAADFGLRTDRKVNPARIIEHRPGLAGSYVVQLFHFVAASAVSSPPPSHLILL
jgi:hypothetical protein